MRHSMRVAALATAMWLATPGIAAAHVMPPGQGSSRVIGNRAHTLLAIPVAALRGFDDDGNGLLSVAELRRHGKELERQIDERVRLLAGGVPGRTIFQTLLIEHSDDPLVSDMASVTLMRISEWDAPVTVLTVTASVFTAADSRISFRAIHGERTEIAELALDRAQHAFFDAAAATPAPVLSTAGGTMQFKGVLLLLLLAGGAIAGARTIISRSTLAGTTDRSA